MIINILSRSRELVYSILLIVITVSFTTYLITDEIKKSFIQDEVDKLSGTNRGMRLSLEKRARQDLFFLKHLSHRLSNIDISKNLQYLNIEQFPRLAKYSNVIIRDSNKTIFEYKTKNHKTLEIDNIIESTKNLKRGEIYFSNYFIKNGKITSYLGTPLIKDRKNIGVILLELPLKKLDSDIRVVRQQIINRSYEKDIFSYIIVEGKVAVSTNRLKNIDTKFSILEETLKKLKIEKIVNIKRIGLSGEESFISFSEINFYGKNYILAVEVSKSKILSKINRKIFHLILLNIVIAMTLVGFVLLLFIRYILNPMKTSEEFLKEHLKNSETILHQYKRAVDVSSILSKADVKGNITFVNDAFCKISKYSRLELLGVSHSIIRDPEESKTVFIELWKTITDKKIWKGVLKNRKKDGSFYYADTTIIPIINSYGEIQEFVAIKNDITEFISQKAKIRKQATDLVTSLPNRIGLRADIEKSDKNLKLAIISMDKFTEVNNFYGEEKSNLLTLEIKNIISSFIYRSCNVYKLTQNKFAILDQDGAIINFTETIKKLIVHLDRNTIIVDNTNFHIPITVGIAYGTKEKILINAEIVLQSAITSSKSILSIEDYKVFEDQYSKNIAMTNRIKNAINTDNIIIFGQEIRSNFKDGKRKYEVLARMREGHKIISPYFFLDIAKKSRLHSNITRTVIDKSFRYFRDKDDEFSINLSMEDIVNPETAEYLEKMILENGVGDRLILEIVESEEIDKDSEKVFKFIAKMKSLGCRIAIDDFGTGYSNFDYLIKLDADFIKIDGSLIKDLDKESSSEAVIEMVVEFANKFNLETVAEFVHNKAILEVIKTLGVKYSQGFYLAEPTELKI